MIDNSDIDKSLVQENKNYRYRFYGLILVTFVIFPFNYILSLYYLLGLILSMYIIGLIAFKRRANFNCIKCGLCCRLRVTPTEKDIKKIEKNLNLKRESFIEGGALKRINGYCMFLKKEGENNICSVYKNRPAICRTWPFYSKSVYFKWFLICPAVRNMFKPNKIG